MLATSLTIGIAGPAVRSANAAGPTSPPSEVRDINQLPVGAKPSQITDVGGTVFFTASDAAHGMELWKSDGTTGGTTLVKDIDPGNQGSNPRDLTDVNGTLYFAANDGSHGDELWKSDGTAAGTVLVKDIVAGAGNSYPSELTDVNGTLLFTASDSHGSELWKSDGTGAGTLLVKDINPGSDGSDPVELTNVNGTLFFSASDGSTGKELWKSDGTAAGTVLVSDINPGSDGSNPTYLTDVSGTLFFVASDASHGQELWKSDGTAAGTVLVKDINPGAYTGYPAHLTDFNGTLFLTANDGSNGDELWKSDGTTAGTVMVKDIDPGASNSFPADLTVVNGTLFFSADDGSTGDELWKSDGTTAGTVMVKDINPGPSNYGNSSPTSLTDVNGTLFLTANDGSTGQELWKSDGTAAGTVLVKDIKPGAGSSFDTYYGGDLTNVNGTLFFTNDVDPNGEQLWKSDGSAAGTVAVSAIDGGDFGSDPNMSVNVNGTLFFAADDGSHGEELWKSDGTAAGTLLVKDINPGAGPSLGTYHSYYVTKVYGGDLTNVNGTLFFTASDGSHGEELWKSDGSAAGTVMVKDINPGPNGSNATGLTNVNGTLFFSANDGSHGQELWKSDGTAAGTVMVKDINPGSSNYGNSSPSSLTDVNGTLFFSAVDGSHGDELWKSDGTNAGTVLVKDINPGPNSYGNSFPSVLTNVNGTLFFTANDGTHGLELWKSDGTDAGTMLVKDIRPGAVGSIGGYYSPGATFTSINGTLFFAANDGSSGNELWKSDGTAAGTVLVKDIKPGASSSNPTDLTNFNGSLFFAADDGATGRELWKSDGSAAGTVLVKDINPGVNHYGGSSPGGLTDVNGTLFFSAYDGSSGYELWSSDGTTAGTLLVKDINPGSHSAYPSALTAVNGTLFFAADDGTTGQELWKAPAPQSPTSTAVSCSPGAGTLGSAESCTVTVTDQLSGAITPTGSVSFAASPTGGTFGSTSCTLAAKNATAASCTVTFVPTVAAGYTIAGSYGGDSAHTASSGAAPLTAYGPTGKAVVRQIKISGTTAKVTIACTGQTGQTCPVALTMTAAEAKKKTVPVGKSSKTLRARKTVVVNVPLNRTGKRLLIKFHKLPVKLVVHEKSKMVTTRKLTFKSTKKH